MRLLELFCGTKSISKEAIKLGWEVFTIDNDESLSPDLCIDIRKLNKNQIPFIPDVIWASPPCQSFSIASLAHHWTHADNPKSETAVIGAQLVTKTFEIFSWFPKCVWYMENPMGKLRVHKVMNGIVTYNLLNNFKRTVTYCQYGMNIMKPTDIFTNSTWIGRPVCKNGDPCHEASPRKAKNAGTQGLKNAKERGMIPPQLCVEILNASL